MNKEELAKRVDDFIYDADSYEYHDQYISRNEGYEDALSLLDTNPLVIRDYIVDMMAEGCLTEDMMKDADQIINELDGYIQMLENDYCQ